MNNNIINKQQINEIKSLLSKSNDYLTLKQLYILTITWNVNGKHEDSNNLNDLFNISINNINPHIITLGIQEIIDLNPRNVVSSEFTGLTSDKVNKWCDSIITLLNTNSCYRYDNYEYVLLASQFMVGLWICTFVKKNIEPMITNLQTASLPRGAGGMLGNKGAVYLRFDLLDSSICFINSHLAAHQHKTLRRNQDYHAIISTNVFIDPLYNNLKSMKSNPLYNDIKQNQEKIRNKINTFSSHINKIDNELFHHSYPISVTSSSSNDEEDDDDEEIDVSTKQAISNLTSGVISNNVNSNVIKLKSITSEAVNFSADDHDIIFFIGDLNYRIDKEMNQVIEYLNTNPSMNELILFDQLTVERQKENIFNDFCEGEVMFLPTYQFIPNQVGTKAYDTRPDKKMRVPSWCDRVLWRIGKYKQLNYNSKMNDNSVYYNKTDSNIGSFLLNNDLYYEKNELLLYESIPQYIISDHKPVRALFSTTFKKLDFERRDRYIVNTMKDYFKTI